MMRVHSTRRSAAAICLVLQAGALAVIGCSKNDKSWAPSFYGAGWSRKSSPVVVEFHPSGFKIAPTQNPFDITWISSGGHYEALFTDQKRKRFELPLFDDVLGIRILDEDNFLVAGQKKTDAGHVMAAKFHPSSSSTDSIVSIELGRGNEASAYVSDDLSLLAMSTTSGVIVRDLRTGIERTYLPQAIRATSLRISKDNRKLAAEVCIDEASAKDYPVLERLRRTQVMRIDAKPGESLTKDTPYLAGLVQIDLDSGAIKEAQPEPGPMVYGERCVDDLGNRSLDKHAFSSRYASAPFYFRAQDSRMVPNVEMSKIGSTLVVGPYMSPDGRKLGFSLAVKKIEWIDLETGTVQAMDTSVDPLWSY